MPSPFQSRRASAWVITIIALVGLSTGLSWYRFRGAFGAKDSFAGTYQTAVLMDLDVRLTKDGELQAINFVDVINRVEGINTVQELVKEGTYVHKGDKLVVLDSSN